MLEAGTDVLVSLDFDPPCDGCPVAWGCDRPASWRRTIPGACEHLSPGLLCDEHKAESIRRHATGFGAFCTICMKSARGVMVWAPLRGKP